jgi:hypothetical protein
MVRLFAQGLSEKPPRGLRIVHQAQPDVAKDLEFPGFPIVRFAQTGQNPFVQIRLRP